MPRMPAAALSALACALPLVVGSSAPVVAAEDMPKSSSEVLFEQPVTLPSREINAKVRRVTFPVGYKSPLHTHKGPGPRYILKGSVEVVEGGTTATYHAGEVFWESGIEMTAENVGDTEAEIVIFELLPVE